MEMDRVTAQLGACVETSSLFQFGAKVFMDAREPVTLEEGDRYSLAPPSFAPLVKKYNTVLMSKFAR